ncbi:MAG: FIVAR domain-containing protein, partial [Peptococcaceae bacterium]|nr:FIVAR domain-containing protein [Peptococcaceae bacterium]
MSQDGLYRAIVKIMHAGGNIPSMANSTVANGNIVYVNVADNKKTLYLEMQPLLALGWMGYLSQLSYFDGGSSGTKTPAEVLSYYTAEEINTPPGDGGMAADLGLTYPKRIAIPLNDIENDGGYLINVIVPIMDALGGGTPGDGSGTQNARVFFTSVTEYDGSNPYASYDKTVIGVNIEQARTLLNTLSDAGKTILTPAIATAQAAYDADPQTDAAILAARDALRVAIETAQAATEPETVNKNALETKLTDAAAYTADDYTEASYDTLQTAIAAAETVFHDGDATQDEVDAQVAALNAAIDNLVPQSAGTTVDTGALETAIYEAKQLSATAASYEPNAYAALTAAVTAAEAALQTAGLTQGQIDAQSVSLTAATDALIGATALKLRLVGEVSLAGKTQLLNYSNPNQNSMGNAAIDHAQSKIVVDGNGNAELRLYFGPLSTLGFSGYLQSLAKVTSLYYDGEGYIDRWDKINATIYAVYDGVTDAYGPAAGTRYPRELGIPVTIGDTDDVIVEVFVPVMDAISPGSGTQLARLRIDWSGIDASGESAVAADVTTLTAAIADADANADADNYTAASYNALAKSVEAGSYLIANNETLTVTQAMVNSRTAAITAARNALLAPENPNGDDPDGDDPNGDDPDGDDPNGDDPDGDDPDGDDPNGDDPNGDDPNGDDPDDEDLDKDTAKDNTNNGSSNSGDGNDYSYSSSSGGGASTPAPTPTIPAVTPEPETEETDDQDVLTTIDTAPSDVPLSQAPVQREITKTDLTYIYGQNRLLTALAISKQGWTSAHTVILAPGGSDHLIDALAVAPLAYQENAPILISVDDDIDTAIL